MPIYCYRQTEQNGCDLCRHGFELRQKITDVPLQHCPECGVPVNKIITAVHVHTGLTSGGGHTLSEKNISKQGFTQYRKVGPGQYEKTAGKQGPDQFNAKDLKD
ncbi:FmdB family zinc ribbon protein [Marinicella gelatinilytica]|uniref:FmdB family zinc ribbon protein n=1 Tax=Marinicella gelatinilytica TaxID=2996017 RepID=UPI002260C807|nr:zinc ribbon domain-containing protein [Marinicella gelatinilytica]MCX7545300.1 zinc ribbon domain-containing protein [Marinicella gelatinilytica]